MPDQSKNLSDETLMALLNSTPSLESVAGRSPSDSPAGTKRERSGPGVAPASPSARRAKAKASKTSGTCGPNFYASSPSGDLQRSLESKLRARLDVNGSFEYELTWKHWATESGSSICALRARARPTSDNDFTGWPTAAVRDERDERDEQMETIVARQKKGKTGAPLLPTIARLAGWPKSPMASDGVGGVMEIRPGTTGKYKLRDYAMLAGWATARATDASNPAGMSTRRQEEGKAPDSLHLQVHGLISELFLVPTGKRVVLAPEFSLWLMGFPEAWQRAAPNYASWRASQAALALEYSKALEMQSTLGSPRSS